MSGVKLEGVVSPVVIVEVIVGVRVRPDEVFQREVLPVSLTLITVTEQVGVTGEGPSCSLGERNGGGGGGREWYDYDVLCTR